MTSKGLKQCNCRTLPRTYYPKSANPYYLGNINILPKDNYPDLSICKFVTDLRHYPIPTNIKTRHNKNGRVFGRNRHKLHRNYSYQSFLNNMEHNTTKELENILSIEDKSTRSHTVSSQNTKLNGQLPDHNSPRDLKSIYSPNIIDPYNYNEYMCQNNIRTISFFYYPVFSCTNRDSASNLNNNKLVENDFKYGQLNKILNNSRINIDNSAKILSNIDKTSQLGRNTRLSQLKYFDAGVMSRTSKVNDDNLVDTLKKPIIRNNTNNISSIHYVNSNGNNQDFHKDHFIRDNSFFDDSSSQILTNVGYPEYELRSEFLSRIKNKLISYFRYYYKISDRYSFMSNITNMIIELDFNNKYRFDNIDSSHIVRLYLQYKFKILYFIGNINIPYSESNNCLFPCLSSYELIKNNQVDNSTSSQKYISSGNCVVCKSGDDCTCLPSNLDKYITSLLKTNPDKLFKLTGGYSVIYTLRLYINKYNDILFQIIDKLLV